MLLNAIGVHEPNEAHPSQEHRSDTDQYHLHTSHELSPCRGNLSIGTAVMFLGSGGIQLYAFGRLKVVVSKKETTLLEHDLYLVTDLQNSIDCDKVR
ncbi:hypothetical protein [Afipia sp. Root123D2]|uniref:hypothetical protein n=1 Tax=Afipia sp. Root123D2 TaxID=1736436 RepID=UPI0012E99262|nr:hypothetical protein [Afipia sp. Root123D2]